jgi:hypothetical protein
MQEMRIFGPPGTGKTTKLSKEIIPKLAFIYDSQAIMITSFTRAAAEELASRLDEYNPDIVGTLHSICYRALNFPELTEKHINEWNKEHSSLQIDSAMKKEGSKRMARYQTYRNKMIKRESWAGDIRSFADQWEQWKARNGYMDFMDLIETAGGLFSPPGSPKAIVVDEAQDFSRLEMSIIRRWGTQVKELWVTGDDDQCLVFDDTIVETITGAKKATDLNFEKDRLVCFDKDNHGVVDNHGTGYPFEMKIQEFNGQLFQILVEKSEHETRCTPDHKWIAWISPNICKINTKTMYKHFYKGRDVMLPCKDTSQPFGISWRRVCAMGWKKTSELIFGISVKPHHTFIANNLCTCNCLYSFTGASPVNMLNPPLPNEQKIVLDQSYRIPAAVHRLAEKIIHRVKNREPKQYLPKKEEGEVNFCSESILDVEWIVKKALSLPGKTMILTSCNYMLHGLIAELKDQGVPFSNPWKPEEKSWNPISNKTSQFFIDFLNHGEDSPYWNTEQFISFAQHIKVGEEGLVRKKGKIGIKQLTALLEDAPDTPGLHTCREYIKDILSPQAIEYAIKRDHQWLTRNIASAKVTPLKYPIKVFETHGIEALEKEPNIHVGTIHSVKGAGSENVIICPDISYAGMLEYLQKEGFENTCRLFYVGITRTKEKLFILSPSDRNFFDFN